MGLEQRRQFWEEQFSRCLKCYACRAACPLCYCSRCTVECNQPQWIPVPAHDLGNLEWNVMRAMHLAGRCVNCGDCSRACPVGIPLYLLNQELIGERFRRFRLPQRPGGQGRQRHVHVQARTTRKTSSGERHGNRTQIDRPRGAGEALFAMARRRAGASWRRRQRGDEDRLRPGRQPGRGQPRPGADRAVAQDRPFSPGSRSCSRSRARTAGSRSANATRRRVPRTVIFGLRPCDAAAFAVAGRPFSPGITRTACSPPAWPRRRSSASPAPAPTNSASAPRWAAAPAPRPAATSC